MAHEEYLRRNLLHAGSLGAIAGVEKILKRLTAKRDTPKWLIEELAQVKRRIEPLPPIVATWRNSAPDSPFPEEKEK